MKKLVFLCIFVLFLAPQISGASSDAERSALIQNSRVVPFFIEQKQLYILQTQINLLLKEIVKLQEMLNSVIVAQINKGPIPKDKIIDILENGVNWFKEAQEESGHFKYEYVPYEDKYLDGDNIVRQAGALYALGEIVAHDENNAFELKETIEKSINFFENQSMEGSVNGVDFRCIANSKINNLCQLGTTGLALAGVIDLVERYPELDEKYGLLIDDYGSYIVAMKKEDAGFRGTYNSGGTLSERESSFSNGEALLALVRYYKYSPDEKVKKVIDDSFTYFESSEVEFDFPLYLWAMAGLKDMYELWGDERYITYTKEYTDWRINGFLYRKNSTHNMCAYTEGLLSAYSVLEDSLTEIEKERYLNEINFWLNKSKSLQLDEGDLVRIINDEGGTYFGEIKNKKQAFGGFLTGESELTQRIDFTQHCLNGYLQKLVDIDKEKISL